MVPFLLLALCPLMHVFMHRGHKDHKYHRANEKSESEEGAYRRGFEEGSKRTDEAKNQQ